MVSFLGEQLKDPWLKKLIRYLEEGELPQDDAEARKVVLQSPLFTMYNGMLQYFDSTKWNSLRVVVPAHLQGEVIDQCHRSPCGGHFSAARTHKVLSSKWWWDKMYSTTDQFVKGCPGCAVVSGAGRHRPPPLHPIPVKQPFQIVEVDVMDLPVTTQGNKHVVVFQDYLTKWPMVYPVPDQKAHRIARLLVDEIIPFYRVPENLLSDRGTDLLSTLMKDLCQMLGIKKLNTTAYHPACDEMVERFNRTLKAMLRKHAARFGRQWDCFLPGVLYAYRNTPHESTGEKPSFLLFGTDLRSPTEASYLPPSELKWTVPEDYREEVITMLSSARSLAEESIKRAQKTYKHYFDLKSKQQSFRIGDLVLVRFPHEEQGKLRKLSRPWHGPYRVVSQDDPDISVVKVYFPQEPVIQVHQTRVCPCPVAFPPGYYWYGHKQHSSGPPRWVENLLKECVLGQSVECEGSYTNHSKSEDLDYPENFGPDNDVSPIVGESNATSEGLDPPDNEALPMVEPEPEVESEATERRDRSSKTKYPLRRRVKPSMKLCHLSLEASSK